MNHPAAHEVKGALEDCALCGGCKARCPVYELTLNEAHSPRGRLMLIRALGRGEMKPTPLFARRLMGCTLCGLCDTACPVGLRPTEFIYESRAAILKTGKKRFLLHHALGAAFERPALGVKALRAIGKLGVALPLKIKELPERPPQRPIGNGLQVIKPPRPKGRVALFAGCATNFLMPSTGEGLIRMLTALGYEVVLPRGELCCGAPLRGLGLREKAVRVAEKNLGIFGKLQVEAVVSPCPTCAHVLRHQYENLAGEGVSNAVDAVEFLCRKLDERLGEGAKEAGHTRRLLWHEPCHLRATPGLYKLLGSLGIKRVEAGCCGLSAALGEKGLPEMFLRGNALAFKGAEAVVTACPGCVIQLERAGLKVIHLFKLIEERFFKVPA